MWEDIVVENAQGHVEPMPSPAPVFTAASSDPSGNAVIGTNPISGKIARGVNALFASGTFTATVSAPGLSDWVETFDIGEDPAPALVAGDAASITTVPQPIPPAAPAPPVGP